MKKILALVPLLIFAVACTAPPGNTNMTSNGSKAGETKSAGPSEADIIAKEKAGWDAIKKKDWDALGKLLASDFIDVEDDGVFDKAGSVASLKDYELSDVTYSDWKMLTIDKDAVILTYNVNTKGTNKGQAIPPGPADQRPNESRSDVLVFSTPPLTEDTEVTGFITLELYAATSAVDTDFTALLVDVDETGYARFLTDGIVRARYRESTKQAAEVTPGKIYKYTIDLWATANVFKTGHRIRLYISSSNFPRFNRNLNTGEDIVSASRSVRAHQTIYHDREHSSSLILPLIPRRKTAH